ncbi:MAG: hypothetical protein ACK5LK_05085 [Chthoniobacterales bacterium]
MRFHNVVYLLPLAVLLAGFAGCSTPAPEVVQMESIKVLPLELQEDFQIRKIKRFFYDPDIFETTQNESVNFDRESYRFGAITQSDVNERKGNYYDVFWRSKHPADVKVRFEYRQAGLGNYLSAKEAFYPQARGSFKTAFNVLGDEFYEGGRVTSWRVVLIVNDRIVAFKQSFMWK